jgi:outer membrane lipopolysaccharide assembly protein LptE/RlpB
MTIAGIAEVAEINPRWRRLRAIAAMTALTATLCGCGYHTSTAAHLPPDVRTIAVPAFVNQTHSYRVEQLLTAALVHELVGRTRYHVTNEANPDADATLRGTVVGTSLSPLTYDSATGHASTVLVTINLKVQLVRKGGGVLYENANYTFRDEYQVSREISSFFDEESPALERLSRDFARTLVSNILEGY